jgi:hypothetical protein
MAGTAPHKAMPTSSNRIFWKSPAYARFCALSPVVCSVDAGKSGQQYGKITVPLGRVALTTTSIKLPVCFGDGTSHQ